MVKWCKAISRKDRRDAERQGEKKDGEVMYSSLQKRQEGCKETEGSGRGWGG